ncbi:hypothetical protein GGTG_06445 [Gaeumannomyces tritici R3-111a-1]|uniref:Uncharacterized protein n=1 Tax=Gaeumannomyces tritici (strain R3-111a-1) TaxID=644352 RepID=J3NYU3_GAET3|nr:hypothetical protein GGTG_06445 [Gaeumannomyces tritici R3-111a-1]EJT76526.1 hypothetical protein GGTG_06445 [Gaeumannomyces tritici R3-111a-1]
MCAAPGRVIRELGVRQRRRQDVGPLEPTQKDDQWSGAKPDARGGFRVGSADAAAAAALAASELELGTPTGSGGKMRREGQLRMKPTAAPQKLEWHCLGPTQPGQQPGQQGPAIRRSRSQDAKHRGDRECTRHESIEGEEQPESPSVRFRAAGLSQGAEGESGPHPSGVVEGEVQATQHNVRVINGCPEEENTLVIL